MVTAKLDTGVSRCCFKSASDAALLKDKAEPQLVYALRDAGYMGAVRFEGPWEERIPEKNETVWFYQALAERA